MAHRFGQLAAAAALLVLLAACAGTTTAGGVSSAGSCSAQLRFRGHVYAGTSLRTHPPYTWTARVSAAHMHVIGTGVVPACQDTNHHSADQDQSVPVARIDGVDPEAAVAVYPCGLVYVSSFSVIHVVLKSARGIRWDYSS